MNLNINTNPEYKIKNIRTNSWYDNDNLDLWFDRF